MNKPKGYDEAAATEAGAIQQLPPGNYVCVIKQAAVQQSSRGNEMIVLLLDIDEGEFKGYFDERFKATRGFNPDAKWPCVYRQLTQGNSTRYFKGMIKAIEESNSGYTWNWDEKTLKGKRIGVLFGREEFIGNDGETKMSCKPRFVCSTSSLQGKAVLEDKRLSNTASVSNGFTDLGEVSEDDLPF